MLLVRLPNSRSAERSQNELEHQFTNSLRLAAHDKTFYWKFAQYHTVAYSMYVLSMSGDYDYNNNNNSDMNNVLQ